MGEGEGEGEVASWLLGWTPLSSRENGIAAY